MNQASWAALWVKEGGDKGKADLASAVVMGESGGDEKSTSNPCCKGGYQINVEVGNTSLKCALNAPCATRWAIKNSKNGNDWSQWEAYTDGAYKQYLGKSGITAATPESEIEKIYGFALSHTPIIGGPLSDLLGVGGGSLNPLSGIDSLASSVEGIARLIEELFKASFWVRFGKGLLGALLIIYALQGMMKATLGIDVTTIAKAAALK